MRKRNIKIVLSELFMKRFLTRHLGTYFPGAKKITFFYSKYLRFLSEESFLVRYEIDLLMTNGKTVTRILRGNRVKPETFPIMQFFYNHFTKQNHYIIARPLAYLNEFNFILYEEYNGWVLREFDHDIDVIKKTVPTIARQLAEIHNASPKLGVVRTTQDEKKYFLLLSKKVRRYLPTISRRFDQYTKQYLQKLGTINEKSSPLLNHGDFQASNIIYDLRTQRIGFIDFTSATRTSPANDVATFLSHTRAMLCFLAPRKNIDRLEKLFLKHYYAKANKNIVKIVKNDLPTYQGRISLDIITTTAVFTEYNKSPYYMTIINELFKRARANLS